MLLFKHQREERVNHLLSDKENKKKGKGIINQCYVSSLWSSHLHCYSDHQQGSVTYNHEP